MNPQPTLISAAAVSAGTSGGWWAYNPGLSKGGDWSAGSDSTGLAGLPPSIEEEMTLECDIYPKRGVRLVRGENALVWDSEGRQYIDCIAGHGVASVGHCNPWVTQALIRQAQTLITCPGTFFNDARARFLNKLMTVTPKSLKRAFLCNSGAESIEAAIKFARYHTGRTDVICARRSFHGRTLGALSATFNPKYKKEFEPLVPGFSFIPFNDIAALRSQATQNHAAVLLEIVQGEGGVYPGQREYFREVREFCREKGLLLILDEIQTGFCRTGAMFACQHFELEPDMICVAKAMAGGLPAGAVICTETLRTPSGNHGSTFGGNPLVCAVAEATLDFMIQYRLADEAREKGAELLQRLKALQSPLIREVRGMGLMIGIELNDKVKPYLLTLMGKGVLALPAGTNVLRLLPPLTIDRTQLDEVIAKIAETLLAA